MEENKNPVSPPVPKKLSYAANSRELSFGAGTLLLAMLTCNAIVYGGFNLGFALGSAGLMGWSAWHLRKSGCRFGRYEKALLFFALALALGYGRSGDGLVKFCVFFLLILAVNLCLILAAGQNRRSPDRAGTLLDGGRAVFRLGFGGMGATCSDLTQGIRYGGTGLRKFGAVGAGLLLCIPLLPVMVSLLTSADAAFEGVMDLMPEFQWEEAFYTVLWGSLLGWILCSRGLRLTRDPKPEPAPEKPGKANALTVNTVLIMVCILYGVYLISQLAYLSGGLFGILPEGCTLAQYARRGFFEMAWLCTLNLGILCLSLWQIRQDGGLSPVTKATGTFLGAVTIFLVLTASAKMLLYIGSFGLTSLRILTEVFMLWLAITTVLVTARIYAPKLPYMKAVVLTALALAALVFWVDVKALSANYNRSAYQSGKLDTIDLSYLQDLGSAGVPALAALTGDSDPEVARQARELLAHQDYRVTDLREWNLSLARAEAILESCRDQE